MVMVEKVRTTSRTELFDLLGVDAEGVAQAEQERDAYVLGWQLAQIRKNEGASQVSLAAMLGIEQSRISKIEHGLAPTLQTLQAYIEGLGGQLRIEADFGNRSYLLNVTPVAQKSPSPTKETV